MCDLLVGFVFSKVFIYTSLFKEVSTVKSVLENKEGPPPAAAGDHSGVVATTAGGMDGLS